ncbi:hypothetical protein [Bradyrhizobium sp. STM 3557]|uniref:hypothetical protein n=1 Tax=Bradyrhizobium sp. STM 3557 TaxID=578920 RepID=UPI00388D9AD5
MIDWTGLIKTLTSTAIVVAALGWIASKGIEHWLGLQVENHKSALDQQVETFKSDLKAKSDRQLEEFKNQLTERTAQKDRIRNEVARWSNPIPSAVTDLKNRLENILDHQGYLALSPKVRQRVNPQWSIQYDYFFPSTIYLFSRYFCWTGLLEEKLSFELFDKEDDKEAFFARMREVNRNLSGFPLDQLQDIKSEEDSQIFNLQQRSMGETLRSKSEPRCISYSEFLERWSEPNFRKSFEPLTTFIEGIEPSRQRPWKRLELMREALSELERDCKKLLGLKSTKADP